ncbi:hypothetical protein ACEW7V_00570 [Areca yellow leaf disease phytoplasma]
MAGSIETRRQKSKLLIAADTFRAGAVVNNFQIWAKRVGVL